jgi:hypothetical protein
VNNAEIIALAAKHFIRGDTIEFVRELLSLNKRKIVEPDLAKDDAFQRWVDSEVARLQQYMGIDHGQT